MCKHVQRTALKEDKGHVQQEARAQAQPGLAALIEAAVSPPVVAPEKPSSKRAAHSDDEAAAGDARVRRGLVRGRSRPRARARVWGKGLGGQG